MRLLCAGSLGVYKISVMAIYKYLHQDRIDVLDNLKIRFTQPSALNDPFESLPMIERIMEENDFYKLLNDHVGENELRKTIKDTIRHELRPYERVMNLDFSLSEEFIDEVMNNFEDITQPFIREALNPENLDESYSQNFKKRFSTTFGILSLTQNPDNLLMWSHYSDSHRGFLIEFKEGANFFDQQISDVDTIRKLKKVRYVTERPQIESLFDPQKVDQDDYMEELMSQFFYIKSERWEYEMEMRMILPLENSDETFELPNGEKVHLFSIPPNLIKSVVLGSQMPERTEEKLFEILKRGHFDHIDIYRAKLDINGYKVNIVNA